MRLRLVYVVLAVLIAQESWAEVVKVDFEKIPDLVRSGNQHAAAAQLSLKAEESTQGHLKRSLLPRLAAEVGGETYKTGSQPDRTEPFGGVRATWNLYRGGRDKLEEVAIGSRTQVVKADADESFRMEVEKARRTYWLLVSQSELIGLLQSAISENEKHRSAALSRIRAGIATDTDRMDFELREIALRQDLARAELGKANLERELKVLLGLQANAVIEIVSAVAHDHSDGLLNQPGSVSDHPIARRLTAHISEVEARKAQSQRWWLPSIDAYAGYGLLTFREREYEPQGERLESSIGIRLSIEVFDGLVAQAESSRRALELLSLQKNQIQTTRELEANLDGARAELRLTHELIHNFEEALKKSATYLNRTLDEYRRGVKNSPDVLAASERHLEMRRRYAELRRDYQVARVALMGSLGK